MKDKELLAAQKTTEKQPKKSVAQAKKGASALFYTFERTAFSPKSVENEKGRKKGAVLDKKQDQKVNRKAGKKKNKSDFANKMNSITKPNTAFGIAKVTWAKGLHLSFFLQKSKSVNQHYTNKLIDFSNRNTFYANRFFRAFGHFF